MKNNTKKRVLAWMMAAVLCLSLGYYAGTASAETTGAALQAPTQDTSPAIYVAAKNANTAVGIVTNSDSWDPSTRQDVSNVVSQGSGVCIREGGYVVTNNHVVESGSSYQVLMPSGELADAELIGTDSSTDIAVLRVVEEYRDQLVPVAFGSVLDLPVGSTVVAIGNPGGDVLANTVTQGIVSALERSNVSGGNTTRYINYIQHDAAINSGNSGGGLFNYKGELVGINTLKYSNSAYSSVTVEGLGFAIPVETVKEISDSLIENGKVVRPQMGVTVVEWDGPDEPKDDYPPSSVYIYSINEGSPAEEAKFEQYDFIYSVDGVRVKTLLELTSQMDSHEAGDTVEVVVVRYKDLSRISNTSSSYYGSFGSSNPFGGSSNTNRNFEFVTLYVTLEILDD